MYLFFISNLPLFILNNSNSDIEKEKHLFNIYSKYFIKQKNCYCNTNWTKNSRNIDLKQMLYLLIFLLYIFFFRKITRLSIAKLAIYSLAIELIKTYLMVRDFDLEGTNKSEEVDIAQLDYLYKDMKNCDQDPALAKKSGLKITK